MAQLHPSPSPGAPQPATISPFIQFYIHPSRPDTPTLTLQQERSLRVFDPDDEAHLKETGCLVPTQYGQSYILKNHEIGHQHPGAPSAREYPVLLGSIACFVYLGFSRTKAGDLGALFFNGYQMNLRRRWRFVHDALDVVYFCPLPDVKQPGVDMEPLIGALGLNDELRELFEELGDRLFDDHMSIKSWAQDIIRSRFVELQQVASRSLDRGKAVRNGADIQRAL
ncbi:hypothetical protein SUNI508_00962 [Seiridium unicorne]|uniref:Uncharacterized protein n=1 Tax=Seiridium unicorne TaxID=138068 RepID=A0ABR2V1Y2_9PEZI